MELRFTNQTEEKTLRAACTVKDDCIIEGPPGLRRDLTEREMKESARDLKLPVGKDAVRITERTLEAGEVCGFGKGKAPRIVPILM
ncbi:hypothetical protein J001_06253 [Cryptococcus neoformans]|nr:hypothetical protein J001_06253 [Cryptococcus neoformans var. grubii]